MDSTLAASGEGVLNQVQVRWAEAPTQELRMPPGVAEWLAEEGGYEGRHWVPRAERWRVRLGYAPRHAGGES